MILFLHLKETKDFIVIYVNDHYVLGWKMEAMDFDSENQSKLEYISFATSKDGETEHFFFGCD